MRCKSLLSASLLVALAACAGAGNTPSGTGFIVPGVAPGHSTILRPGIAAPKYLKVGVFVRGNATKYNPDPIVWENKSIFVAYQNATQPDGKGGDSTIVQYFQGGKEDRSIKVPGRCDGMRWNPYTNLMWLTVNEDANSSMYTWDPSAHILKHYSFSSAKHGGGYDDLAFSNGKAFIAASNPTLIKGINKGPAVISAVLKGSTAEVTPVLMGDATAKDIVTGKNVTLNLTDPDSMTVAPNGDVLLVSQADSEIVWIHDAGKSTQQVSRLLVGTQLDDTAYATQSTGTFYVVDQKKNAIFTVHGHVKLNSLWTEAPDDSSIPDFVGTVDLSNGAVTPIVTGFGSPHGLIFVPRPKK